MKLQLPGYVFNVFLLFVFLLLLQPAVHIFEPYPYIIIGTRKRIDTQVARSWIGSTDRDI